MGKRKQMESEQQFSIKPKPPPAMKEVYATLEEIQQGARKKLKVTRRVLELDVDSGVSKTVPDSKVLTVPISPGMKAGTKFTFHGEGDQSLTHQPQDLVFTLREKTHEVFTRQGDDLHQTVELSLKDALVGKSITIPTITGPSIRINTGLLGDSSEVREFPGQG